MPVFQSSGITTKNCAKDEVVSVMGMYPPRLLVPARQTTDPLAPIDHPAPAVALLQLAAGMMSCMGKEAGGTPCISGPRSIMARQLAPVQPCTTVPITSPPPEGKVVAPVSCPSPAVVDEICT